MIPRNRRETDVKDARACLLVSGRQVIIVLTRVSVLPVTSFCGPQANEPKGTPSSEE